MNSSSKTLRRLARMAWAASLCGLGSLTGAPAPVDLRHPTPVTFPARQVHLDFHTSELIPEVGSQFDRRQWQAALKAGRVNWINLFGKCHHSWCYYPTQAGRKHPNLKFDLLGEQIAACHEIGIRCPIYFTVGWSANDAETHTEWCVRKKDGSVAAINWDFDARPAERRPATSWKFLCPSGDYLKLLLAQTEEICRGYAVDGFFYDIDFVSPPCYCDTCRKGMAAEGIDLDDDAAVAAYNARKWKRWMRLAREQVKRHHPQATVFFNGTTKLLPDHTRWRMWEENTHHELEDLPTTWGGYDKLPLRAKFFHNTGKPIIAMSGKFHTSWGEFGGFKHPDAIRYEAASMIAFGAACNFGDQMHPSGTLDPGTYRNLGAAYEYVQKIEAYGVGGRPVSTLGLWRSGSTTNDEGVVKMLLETQMDFVVVDAEQDLSRCETIILTGAPCLTEAEAAKLRGFTQRGGGLVVLGESALDAKRERFALDVGADYVGPARFEEDYLVLGKEVSRGLVASPFLNYKAALRTRAQPGAEVLATIREPYFDRTYAQYCSHQNTPYQLQAAAHPGAVRRGNTVFLAHKLGEVYYENGARLHRDYFANALRLIYRKPMLETKLPSAGRVSLLHQAAERRYVAHLLYAPPLQRGRAQVIEDLPTLSRIPVALRVPVRIRRAYVIPGERSLKLDRSGELVRVTVPEFECHVGVVFEY